MRIAAKLKAAANVPANLAIFGAQKHRFALNPPIADRAVSEFEQVHGARLPDAYRRFITRLGDGGAGPSYGVLPLGDAYGEVSDSYPGHLATPSPFQPGVAYTDDWWEGFFDEERHQDPCQGAIAVVHHGCTSYTVLIVSGPGRGRLVSIDYNGVPAPYMLEDADFLSWYERWLDELAAGYDVTRIFEKIPGGEQKLLMIARADPNHDRRARAIWSLCALPSMTPQGRVTLADLSQDPNATVRTAALQIVRHLRVSEAEEAARVALRAGEPAVRAAAMSALRALGPMDVAAVAREMLRDLDEEVATRAVWSLRDSGEMTVADLAPLASSPDPRVRVTAIHYLADAVGDGITGLLSAALDDSEARVRSIAVQTIGRRNLSGLRPKLVELLAIETDPTVLVNLRRVVPKFADHRP